MPHNTLMAGSANCCLRCPPLFGAYDSKADGPADQGTDYGIGKPVPVMRQPLQYRQSGKSVEQYGDWHTANTPR